MGSSFWEGLLRTYVGGTATEDYRRTDSAAGANAPPITQSSSRPNQRGFTTQLTQDPRNVPYFSNPFPIQHTQAPRHAPYFSNPITAQYASAGPSAQRPLSSSAPLAPHPPPPPPRMFPTAPPPARISPRPFSRPIPENIRISRPAHFPHHQLASETVNPEDLQTGFPSQSQTATGSGGPLLGPGAEFKKRLPESSDISHGIEHETNPEEVVKRRKRGEPPSLEAQLKEWSEISMPAYDGARPRSREELEYELRLREENLEAGRVRRTRIEAAVTRFDTSLNSEASMVASVKKELAAMPK